MKSVCFAGHRFEWHNIGIKEKLEKTIDELIHKNFCIFYICKNGYFDELVEQVVRTMKIKYPHIKMVRVLTYYQHNKQKGQLPDCYDYSVFPDIEQCYPKQKIIKRNEWLVSISDILVCHIIHTQNSGAYRTFKCAQKLNKPIIKI